MDVDTSRSVGIGHPAAENMKPHHGIARNDPSDADHRRALPRPNQISQDKKHRGEEPQLKHQDWNNSGGIVQNVDGDRNADIRAVIEGRGHGPQGGLAPRQAQKQSGDGHEKERCSHTRRRGHGERSAKDPRRAG